MDEAASTQRLARPDFPSLGQRRLPACPFLAFRSSLTQKRGPPAERRAESGLEKRDSRTRREALGGFISPINFVDSGWRKNWVKSRGRISSIFPSIPIILCPPLARPSSVVVRSFSPRGPRGALLHERAKTASPPRTIHRADVPRVAGGRNNAGKLIRRAVRSFLPVIALTDAHTVAYTPRARA